MRKDIDADLQLYTPEKLNEDLPVVIVNIDKAEDNEAIHEAVTELLDKDFILTFVKVKSWDDDLSPWPNDRLFKGGAPFAGKADTHLDSIIANAIPKIEDFLSEYSVKPSSYYIAGYSLAGLFALYSAYRCDQFEGFVSASGSLWYPGLMNYMDEHEISPKIQKAYFSLGDQEAKTSHPLMSQVEKNTGEIQRKLSGTIKTIFELNEGNHFKDADLRLAKGIAWILSN